MAEYPLGGMGWQRDLPDIRDYTPKTPEIKKVLSESQPLKTYGTAANLPARVDLREWCPPIEDQGPLNSCTAHAGTALLEYYERRAFKKYLDGSRLFLYKVTRNLLGWVGDQGAYLRTTMKAMAMVGIPPEQYMGYDTVQFDAEPSSFVYSLAENYKSTMYYRLDPAGANTEAVLRSIKQYIAAGLPAMFGSTIYSSFPGIGSGKIDIPFPQTADSVRGGHALVVVGYDDARVIGADVGALLVRNSWGVNWGEGGYGWMPYAYVQRGIAVDFWSLAQAKFVDTDLFK